MEISVFSLITSIMLARALFVAADLDIAEHLAAQPMNVEQLAAITQSDVQALTRLLFFLETCAVFAKDDAGMYHLTAFSETMCRNHPHTIRPFLLHDDETRWNSFGHLGHSIKTGSAAFDMLYGDNYFDYIQKNDLLNVRFNEAMIIISAQEDERIAQMLPFSGIVADIGGGTGQLINAIANKHAISQGILFDLPVVIQQAPSLHERCIKHAGSFFDPITITADVFILKRVLHDWDDERAEKIVANVSNAMHDNARLYIIEGILDYSKNKAELAAIDLALLTIFKGKERTRNEFEQLINHAGLQVVSIQQLDDLLCVIECKKRKIPEGL